MGVTLRVQGLERVASALEKIPNVLFGGVKVRGERNTAFALVWEWGRADINPGPKTVWSTNPNGEARVLTKTAPFGYIRVNRQKYIQILREEISAVSVSSGLAALPKLLEAAMDRASERCAVLVGQTAPIDTGELRASIMFFPVTVGDKVLSLNAGTEFDLGTDW